MQLAALARLFEFGPVSQNALGRETAMDAATIKGVVDRLGQRGLLTTRPNQTDRRRMVVELSTEGAELFTRLTESAFQVSDRTLAPLSPAERKSLSSLLARLT
jgi:DNA-binding MarR family transcriptional regulator